MTTENDPRQFFEPPPTPQEKALWDLFVTEYMKDFNPIQAACRVGFNLIFAQEYAKIFMQKPYVLRAIMEEKTKVEVPAADRVERIKTRIESTYIAAMESGDVKSAVLAATKLGEMNGLMKAPDRSGEELATLVDAFKEIAKVVPE